MQMSFIDKIKGDDPYKDAIITTLVGGEKEGFQDGEEALFSNPYGLAVDTKTQFLYICDYDNERIRSVSLKDGYNFVRTVAGNGQKGHTVMGKSDEAKINSPNGITFNGDGNLVFSDQNNLVLRLIKNGNLSSISDKKISSTVFSCPCGVAYCEKRKAFFVTDYKSNMIGRVDEIDGSVSIFVGSNKKEHGFHDGKGLDARFHSPCGITIDKSDLSLYVTDQGNHRIRKIYEDGTVITVAGNGIQGYVDGDALSSQWSCPNGITFDSNNRNLLVVDYWNLKVRSISLEKKIVSSINCSLGNVSTSIYKNPYGIALDAVHGILYVSVEHAVLKVNLPYYNQSTSINKIKMKRENILTTLDLLLKDYDIDHNIELQNIIEEKNKQNIQMEKEIERKNLIIAQLEKDLYVHKKRNDLYSGKGLESLNSKELEAFEKEVKVLAKKVKKKLRMNEKANECNVCCDKKIDTVLLDCGHACCCNSCATKILESEEKRCPVCRREIQKIHMIFIS